MFKKLSFLCFTAILAASAYAAPQASNGRDVVILREQACSNPETLSHIPAEYQKYFFNAEAHIQGKDYKACWTLQGDKVFLVYPDGDTGVLPAALFKEAGV